MLQVDADQFCSVSCRDAFHGMEDRHMIKIGQGGWGHCESCGEYLSPSQLGQHILPGDKGCRLVPKPGPAPMTLGEEQHGPAWSESDEPEVEV